MHGLLIVNAQSGALLFHKAYDDNFGMEETETGDRLHEDLNPKQRRKQRKDANRLFALQLSPFLSAIVHNVSEVCRVSEEPSDADEAKADNPETEILSFDDGRIRMHFCRSGEALGTIMAPRAMPEWAGNLLVKMIMSRFGELFGPASLSGTASAVKHVRRFGSSLPQVYHHFANALTERLLQQLAAPQAGSNSFFPQWVYCLHSASFVRDMAGQHEDEAGTGVEIRKPLVPLPPAAPKANHNAFSSQARVRTRMHQRKFPFQPQARRWWHFGSPRKESFFALLGPTSRLYTLSSASAVSNMHDEEACPADSQAKCGLGPDSVGPLVSMIHAAGTCLSVVADQLEFLELTLTPRRQSASSKSMWPWLNSASVSASSSGSGNCHARLFVLRIQEFLIAFPVGISDSEGPAPVGVTSVHAKMRVAAQDTLSALVLFFRFMDTHVTRRAG